MHSDETVRKEPDTKCEFDYDKFIRRNITSTVQTKLKEKPSDKGEYELKEQVTYRSLQKELDLDCKTKYNVLDMSIESTDTELKQEINKRESLQTREQEIENQEMALTRRQETEERLQKLQKESEAEMLKKLKEERRHRDILLAARENELRERTTEFDILEKKQKGNRLLGIFQPSTEALLKEEEKPKRDLHKREADIVQQEAELTIRKEKEQSLQQKQRDSEYETILKLRKERKERETLLKAEKKK